MPDCRELGVIPGTDPGVLYHGLVWDMTPKLWFREFIQFHSDRVYPEYLLGYKRVHYYDVEVPTRSESKPGGINDTHTTENNNN